MMLHGILVFLLFATSFAAENSASGSSQMMCRLVDEPIPEDVQECSISLQGPQGPPGEVDYRKVQTFISQQQRGMAMEMASMKRQIASLESKVNQLSKGKTGKGTWANWWRALYRSAVVCEMRVLQLKCRPTEVIKIRYASYGRSDPYTCTGPVKTIRCRANLSTSIVKSACENRQSCSIEASNSVFKDPCVGTFKYLKISYQCASIQTTLACEHRTLTLRCPSQRVIRITSASYGRSNNLTCGGPVKTVACRADKSEEIVKKSCENRQFCTVRASNSVFQDPCAGTFKYLRVQHECVAVRSRVQTREVCEHKRLSLSCRSGEVISILSSSYGRSDRYTCRGPIKTTKCHAVQSDKVVKSACQNRQSCTVVASNGVFGDPCKGTFKYLRVRYQCNTVYG